ncbi:hypothetical protein FQN54_006108 [Arachnomyces sp. PD_36]|nr:hypothetical protein FQN54_006108 [Arachnomyces sp. PD_36]
MLGRLLNTAASNLNPAAYTSRKSTSLESVTEEEHTAGLLFPDVNLLRRSNAHAYPLRSNPSSPNTSITGGFDDHGGLDLDATKDFRVIVAQNALGDRDEPCILLDTHAPNLPPQGLESQGFGGTQGRHSRNSSFSKPPPRRGSTQGMQSSFPDPNFVSLAANARKPNPIGPGAFSHARHRSSTFSLASGDGEPHHNRPSADSNELGLLNCIFGSSAFSYRGSSTKMHILSVDNESNQSNTVSSPSGLSREQVNFGARGFRPAHVRTFNDPRSTSSSLSQENLRSINEPKGPSKFTVLVTRMFSVNLPEGRDAAVDGSEQPAFINEFGQDSAFPFPDIGKRRKIKEKKTPMYAVAIVIQVPLIARGNVRPGSQLSQQGPDFLRPDGTMSFSLDSGQRWSGALHDNNSTSLANLDDRIDMLVDHWDVITRTLSHLEKLASKEILGMLKKVDFFSGQQPKPAKAPNMQRTNQTIIQLPSNMLAGRSKLREEAGLSVQRIRTALKIPRVITGQNRWGIWREEARWISRYLGEKEHSFFFLVLITAFLGNHTEWLGSLGPEWYRRRRHLQQKAHQDNDNIIANRTVIISSDKMIARRLIFLLSAFLPPKQRTDAHASPLRPGTSTSARPVSQSPPNNAPLLRQESLRRTINRRARANRLNLEESGSQDRSLSTSSNEVPAQPSNDVDFMTAADGSKSRRDSDVRSIRTANFPIPTNEVYKSSAATASTATPSAATPVPHFSSQQTGATAGASSRLALERTESLASANLLQTLKRNESSNISSDASELHPSSRWGSLLSGFWSSRQESSTDGTETPLPSQETSYKKPTSESGTAPRSPHKLEQMVKEAGGNEPEQPKDIKSSDNISIPFPSSAKKDITGSLDLPEPSSDAEFQPRESPVRLSVRGDDGVVDVDVPLPGFISLSSSGDSALTSPKRTRTSVTSLEAAGSIHSSGSGLNLCPRDNDGPTSNVSGFLKQFHEDFVLQSVRPYGSLEADIKRSMAAEASPVHMGSTPSDSGNQGSEKWVDVCTTLVADVRTFTVKRIRLRRKINPDEPAPSTGESPASSRPVTPRQQPEPSASAFQFSNLFGMRSRKNSISTIAEIDVNEVEEKYVEEPVVELDDILVDAVERVLARSGQSSLAPSRAPSPSRGRRAARDNNDQSARQGEDSGRDDVPSIEVPRTECKKLVLGALEEVVRSVTAERSMEEPNEETNRRVTRDIKRRSADNTLREGVRKWLLDIEECC